MSEVQCDEDGGELSIGERGTEVERERVWCAADVIGIGQRLRCREWEIQAERQCKAREDIDRCERGRSNDKNLR